LNLNRPIEGDILELVDNEGRINLETFNILSHTSIASLGKGFNIMDIKSI